MCPRTCTSFQRVQHQKPFALILTSMDNLDISSSNVRVFMSVGELTECLSDIHLNSTQVGSGCCCDVTVPPPLLRLCDIFQSLFPFTVTANHVMIIDRPAGGEKNNIFFRDFISFGALCSLPEAPRFYDCDIFPLSSQIPSRNSPVALFSSSPETNRRDSFSGCFYKGPDGAVAIGFAPSSLSLQR